MSRFRRYRRYKKTTRSLTSPVNHELRGDYERLHLSMQVDGLDNLIIEKLLNLPSEKEAILFQEYDAAYGMSHVREAWRVWKSRKVYISGMEAQRLIDLAPAVLSYEDRFDIIYKVYQKTRNHEHVRLTVVLGANEAELNEIDNHCLRFCVKPLEHKWPSNITKYVGWFCGEDATAVKALMAAIEVQNCVMISSIGKLECVRLVDSIRNMNASVVGTHRIEFPYGTITLHIQKATLLEKLTHFFA